MQSNCRAKLPGPILAEIYILKELFVIKPVSVAYIPVAMFKFKLNEQIHTKICITM